MERCVDLRPAALGFVQDTYHMWLGVTYSLLGGDAKIKSRGCEQMRAAAGTNRASGSPAGSCDQTLSWLKCTVCDGLEDFEQAEAGDGGILPSASTTGFGWREERAKPSDGSMDNSSSSLTAGTSSTPLVELFARYMVGRAAGLPLPDHRAPMKGNRDIREVDAFGWTAPSKARPRS